MIKVNGLHFNYPGQKESTIRGLDFEIKRGEIFGFLGPSGAGKSTTQKILIGTLKNYKGSAKVMNQELSQVASDYYEKIGVAFEVPNFYSKFTALENLSFFGSLYANETENMTMLLSMVGLEDNKHKRVSEFSKGMKMRLNFCRALLNKPEILFLDEPTSGLDPVNAKIIKEIIKQKKEEGKTIILTTHNMNVAEEICDRVAFIVDGKISLIDSPRQLKINKGKKMVRIEYKEESKSVVEDFEIQDIGGNFKFLSLLREKEIETMHTQEASLEDIFIEVTGRSLQ